MSVNSVHKISVVQTPSSACYVKATIGMGIVLVLTWIELDAVDSIRYFFASPLNSVQ